MHYSPLRYPGGKNKISQFVNRIIEVNGLIGGTYVEPYAGGASLAISLLIEKKVSQIIINDYDRSIYAFWFCVLHDTKNFCDKIKKTPITMKVWHEQRKIQDDKKKVDLLNLGFSTFYLNRTNHSGIISGGPIGGYEQTGAWKIDARFNKKVLIEKIELIALNKKHIKLYNLDAILLIKKLSPKLNDTALIYFDPPYYVKGKDLYVNHYTDRDHVLVAKTVENITDPRWIVSYDNVEQITRLYPNSRRIMYDLKYSLVNGTTGKEVMFFSDNMLVPTEY
jgi:DNA adenine methylase